MSDLEAMSQRLAELHAEYDLTAKPILGEISELAIKIVDAKRERGELFYVDYMRYGSALTEEFASLGEAKSWACHTADFGEGSVSCVRGPGVHMEDWEWEDE